MTTAYDVIVVGGGAVGAACARELALAGRRVLVCERGISSGEVWRAAVSGGVMGSPIVTKSAVFVATHTGKVYAF